MGRSIVSVIHQKVHFCPSTYFALHTPVKKSGHKIPDCAFSQSCCRPASALDSVHAWGCWCVSCGAIQHGLVQFPGISKPVDVASANGKAFLNMATGGFGTEAAKKTDSELKDKVGGAAYAITGKLSGQKLLEVPETGGGHLAVSLGCLPQQCEKPQCVHVLFL